MAKSGPPAEDVRTMLLSSSSARNDEVVACQADSDVSLIVDAVTGP